MDSSNKNDRYYWLDWLRFLAAFGVLAGYARAGAWTAYSQLQNGSKSEFSAYFFAGTRLGEEMVILFFVLSGFLVGGKLLERCRNRTFKSSGYVIDRVTRIWVPMIPALALTFMVDALIDTPPGARVMIGNVLGVQGVFVGYLQNNPALWSLTYEIWLYVLAGSFAALVTREHRMIALLALLLSITVFMKLDSSLLIVWWLGSAAYFLPFKPKLWLPGGLLLAASGIVGMELTSGTQFPVAFARLLTGLPHTAPVLLLGAGLSIIVTSIGKLPPNTAIITQVEAVGSKLAAFSYSLYLVHSPVLAIVDYYSPDSNVIDFTSICMFLFRLLLSLLVAWCFYWVFEARTKQIRRWMQSRFKQ